MDRWPDRWANLSPWVGWLARLAKKGDPIDSFFVENDRLDKTRATSAKKILAHCRLRRGKISMFVLAMINNNPHKHHIYDTTATNNSIDLHSTN